ncbi:MAG TPA: histidine kinase [Candidatus Dormibacteraeota bacterium]|nr:histidine kinase [Candidatus Dormibacteraeota bacterium]
MSALPLALSIWTFLLGAGLITPADGAIWWQGAEHLAIAAMAALLYLVYWLWVWPRRSHAWVVPLVAGMGLLALLDQMLGNGPDEEVLIYAAVVAGCGLAPTASLPAIAILALLTLISVGTTGVAFTPNLQTHVTGPASVERAMAVPMAVLSTATSALPVIVIGGGAVLLTFLARANAELHAARLRLARAAVDEERVRLSRDLHDLLGHSLSLMALKAELASRLLDRPEHPATAELEDLKLMARTTLADLREVVGGARLPTLAGELDGARIAAEAASIHLSIEDRRGGALAPEVEAACAWIVREGMTNVVKHSGARRCRLRIEQQDGTLSVIVADDGRGGAGTGRGSGLRGLGERISAVGGQLRVEPRNGAMGGFQLAARMPLGPEGSGL